MPEQHPPGPRLATVELLDRLISFDTTSRNSNLALIGFVRDYLDRHGVAYRVSTDSTGAKANLHAIIGPPVAGGIALSGHVDTVPVDGQAWTTSPFALHPRDGRLYGRGTTDMKGFVACLLAAVPDLCARRLARPVHLLITYDEETTCNGARRLLDDMAESGLAPAVCLVGEPSEMKPVVAHKGRLVLQVSVRGTAGHSSTPGRGVNAIYAAAEAIGRARAEAARFAQEGPFEDGFDPPHTTVHVGVIKGGSILNIIPEHAEFLMEWRTIPADDFHAEVERFASFVRANIEPEMKQASSEAGFTFTVDNWIPGMSLAPDHELVGLVRSLTGANAVRKVSYGTEAGLYANANIPTIICGPGDIAQAHRPDEWIARDQLDACDVFIRRLTDRFLA